MFPMTRIAASLALLLSAASLAAAEGNGATPRSLLVQAKGLPADFEEHLFDVPLAVQVERDSLLVGEAMVVLTRDDRMTLLEFTDLNGSKVSPSESDLWAEYLKQGVQLGACTTKCPEQLIAVHYNLENSLLSLLTGKAESAYLQSQYHELPVDGSTGLIVRNQLNLTTGQQEQLGGRYGLEASSSLGNWTQTLNMQFSTVADPDQTQIKHAVHDAYTQRELEGQFLRLGYFTPSSLGLTRQIRTFGASPDTTFGVMYGSSDSLTINQPKPSVYPIYVTANREATVEIYRNGLLINTQMVPAGLQSLDTRPLPGGIYEVEVRLVEDGQVSSTTSELVYKPANWRNLDDPWRYNLFAGRESKLLSNYDTQDNGDMTAGASLNYLLHPRVVLGLSGRQIKNDLQWGTSIDWTLADNASLYANVFQTQNYGTGVDLNGQYNYGQGNIALNHTRSWLDTRDTYETLPDGTRLRKKPSYVGQTSSSSVSVNHRVDAKSNLNARLTHSDGYTKGYGLDLGWSQSTHLFGSDGNWRLSVFDRPGSLGTGNQRNRGIDLSVSLALGGPGEQWSASLGSRTSRDGARDNNASLTYRKDLKDHTLQSVSATATTDTYGVGLSGRASFQTNVLTGDSFLQRSSYNGKLSGGLNLDSTVALSGSKMVMTNQPNGQGAGMIVDVESDIADIALRADDLSGGSTILRPGRNFIPITAYKSSSVSFDFQGTDVPAASIQPQRTRYHLNKGGVDYRTIKVVNTVTVLGRLIDPQGNPLKGHHIINHASRGVTEVDGFFSMEMNASTPTLEVRKGEALLCQFRIDMNKTSVQNNVMEIGDLRCTADTLAGSVNTDKVSG
ncbi:TcfC E-set like domain-containing protein [Pseudomonas sp. NKUCC02_KPG]|uniref:TcfC E-set like domain-containing protein n=1 Tax=Pseudomonas sp. NKUCC02_KPG TaxID=2842124 RepID=UPI001C5B4AA2|nr:CS1-pili formation C-terminal domain-containing protein [Pseudomonas sp. NKUCC02_KPG]MBW3503605.1 CS1-pili formation C-terminal domain-containing protein [Pseudomonas sp. NKUCC02_KPG]